MPSSYYDHTNKTVFDGDIARAEDVNDINIAVDTALQLVEADISGAGSDAAYWSDVSQDWAEELEDVEVAAGQYSSLHHAAKAAASAGLAATSESNAASSESTASGAAANALTSETNAATSASNAATSETNAATSETNAGISETNASNSAAAALASKNAAETAETNAEAAEANAATYEAQVISQGNTQVARVTSEGDTQYSRISGLDAVIKIEGVTGAADVPTGTTAQRPTVGISAGNLRYNSDDTQFEGYDGSEWATLGGSIVGQIIMWPLDAPPSGYLICDGAQYAYDTYPKLGALLGGTPGGNFNVPDIDVFAKNSKGTSTGTKQSADVGTHGHTANTTGDHAHTANSGGSHNHSGSSNSTGNHSHSQMGVASGGWDLGSGSRSIADDAYANTSSNGSHSHTISVGSGGSHTHSTTTTGDHTHSITDYSGTNQPACTLINFCIKAE